MTIFEFFGQHLTTAMEIDLMRLSLLQIKDPTLKLVFHTKEMDKKIFKIRMARKTMMKMMMRRKISIVMTAMMKQWSQLLKSLE